MGLFLAENRERIEKNYQELSERFPHIFDEINRKLAQCDADTALACRYLYITMPCSDMGNYPLEYFLDFAENGVMLWKKEEQVRSLPEEIYLNYVLYHRVNEEEIAPCRSFFYEKINEKIKGMDFRAAALEVNYWCAGEASYQSTDPRTLSAMTVYRRGNGRCGEESVFAVNALRSVGIPSRQVYAPRWSHCDDNHAWVEIWCDGEWYFLGACEPEEILNKGWFTNASSRAMMVHSRGFDGSLNGEEYISKEGAAAVFNQLKRYALTKEITVRVETEDGKPAEGAEVQFEVLNYSEYVPAASVMTDEDGMVKLTTGLGSLHLWASKEMGEWLYEETFLDTEAEDFCTIRLKKEAFQEEWKAVDMKAPHDAPVNTDMPSQEQKERGRRRFAEANAMREEKIRTRVNPECGAFLNKEVTDMEDAIGFPFREAMLEVISEKDRTDCLSAVLEEHLDYAIPYWGMTSRETFVKYVMNPRVDDEVMQTYRRVILDSFSTEEQDEMRENPPKIWEAVDNRIVSLPEKERDSVLTTPAGCLKTGIGSFLSKKVLFVAIARTLGVPARLNPEDRSMEYMNEEGEFKAVLESAEKNCCLTLDGGTAVWKYTLNWSLGRLEKGKYVTLNLQEKTFEKGRLELALEAGRYRILTSNRLPNGNIFAYQYEFEIHPGEKKELELRLREARLEDMLEDISICDFELKKEDGTAVSASEITAEGKHILCFLEEEKEPTEHILNEMLEQREAFGKWASRIVFIVRSKDALRTPTLASALRSLGDEVQIYYDDFSEIIYTLGRRMYVDPEKLPLILVTKDSLSGIYAASGYNVGMGDMLLRLMEEK